MLSYLAKHIKLSNSAGIFYQLIAMFSEALRVIELLFVCSSFVNVYLQH